eukprot:15474793-Alexandrium_andersonii.AAC.1
MQYPRYRAWALKPGVAQLRGGSAYRRAASPLLGLCMTSGAALKASAVCPHAHAHARARTRARTRAHTHTRTRT